MSTEPQFSLATVLRVRELAEEQEERALSHLLRELEKLRADLCRTEADLMETAAVRNQAFTGNALPAMHLHASYAAAHELRVRSTLIRRQLAHYENLRAAQVSRYEEARRKREVLCSLRDEARDAWTLAQEKREQTTADEAFLARFMRKRCGV